MKASLVSDCSFTKAETRTMAENWVQLEDDPNIIDAEVDEAIELLDIFIIPLLTMNMTLKT